MKDYYEILGVNEDANMEDIKKAYRKLSLKHHPDKGGDNNTFAEINNAFDTLHNDDKRKEYDMKRKYGENGSGMFGGGGMSGQVPEDIFRMFFGGNGGNGNNGGSQGHPFMNMANMGNNPNIRIFHNGVQINPNSMNKPVPIVTHVDITLEQAYNGIKYPLEIERWVKEDEMTKRIEKETVYININKGIDNNETIIIKEKGNVINDDIKGDVKVFIKINNNTSFIRRGLDLIYQKNISLKEALCGFSFNLMYFNNKSFTITNNNTIIKQNNIKIVQGLGMERNGTKGNVIIEFSISFPENLTLEQREKLKLIL
jgi:DnaJ-class molecular chaperone